MNLKNIYLNNYLPELTVPFGAQPRDLSDQVLIVHYYQPNHPLVNVSINIDNILINLEHLLVKFYR